MFFMVFFGVKLGGFCFFVNLLEGIIGLDCVEFLVGIVFFFKGNFFFLIIEFFGVGILWIDGDLLNLLIDFWEWGLEGVVGLLDVLGMVLFKVLFWWV